MQGLGVFAYEVTLGGALYGGEIGDRTVEQRVAVVLTAAHHHISGTGVLDNGRPFVGIVARGNEFFGKQTVFINGNLLVIHGPHVATMYGVESPMDEDAEPGFAEPPEGIIRGGQDSHPPILYSTSKRIIPLVYGSGNRCRRSRDRVGLAGVG